jgi:hypothetical protein
VVNLAVQKVVLNRVAADLLSVDLVIIGLILGQEWQDLVIVLNPPLLSETKKDGVCRKGRYI